MLSQPPRILCSPCFMPAIAAVITIAATAKDPYPGSTCYLLSLPQPKAEPRHRRNQLLRHGVSMCLILSTLTEQDENPKS